MDESGWAPPRVPIVSPSHLRAGLIKVIKVVPQVKLAVPRAQAQDYERRHPGSEIIPVPDAIVGIARTRQWIYDTFGDVFMLDDDVDGFFRMSGLKVERMTGEQIQAAVDMTAYVARQMGCHLFGFTNADGRNYRPQIPFRLTGIVMGYCMGLLKGSKLYFHPDASLSEDVWVGCLNAYHHRKCFIDRRYGVHPADSSKTPGGCATQRTVQAERDNFLFLRKMFGDVIRLKGENIHWGMQMKTSNVWARHAVIPF